MTVNSRASARRAARPLFSGSNASDPLTFLGLHSARVSLSDSEMMSGYGSLPLSHLSQVSDGWSGGCRGAVLLFFVFLPVASGKRSGDGTGGIVLAGADQEGAAFRAHAVEHARPHVGQVGFWLLLLHPSIERA